MIMKMRKIVRGTMMSQPRLGALLALVFAHPSRRNIPCGSFTALPTFSIASSTVLPRSRPRTLYLTAI